MNETLTFVVDKSYSGKKAGIFLRVVCGLSARTLSLLKRNPGSLTRGGELLRTIDILDEGDIVEINLPKEENSIIPIEGNLDILYEDAYLLIVNKSAATPVHPVKKHQTDTLANFVAYKYQGEGEGFVFRAVNRLDSDTSGAVIITRNRHIASLMQKARIDKHYFAMCHGTLNEGGTVDEPIALREDSKIVRCVTPSGKSAVTHYNPIVAYRDRTLLDIWLETGRTHQIRCHMSHIGHPLMGDDLYGGGLDEIPRQALHCHTISFTHPISGKEINVIAPLPDDMAKLIPNTDI